VFFGFNPKYSASLAISSPESSSNLLKLYVLMYLYILKVFVKSKKIPERLRSVFYNRFTDLLFYSMYSENI
jgi:hypothetical protein